MGLVKFFKDNGYRIAEYKHLMPQRVKCFSQNFPSIVAAQARIEDVSRVVSQVPGKITSTLASSSNGPEKKQAVRWFARRDGQILLIT